MLLLIRILPSRPAPRNTLLASKWLAARLWGKPGHGGIVMPGSAPSCLPGPEMKVIIRITRIQEFKQNQKSTLGRGLQQAEMWAASELWFWGADSPMALDTARGRTAVAGKEFVCVSFPEPTASLG